MNLSIRRFQELDAAETSAVIGETLRVSNAPDYAPEAIQEMLDLYTPAGLLEQAGESTFMLFWTGTGSSAAGESRPIWAARRRASW